MREISITEKAFFYLLAVGLWDKPIKENFFPLDEIQWKEVMELSRKQALLGIVFDGIVRLQKNNQPPLTIKLQWIATVQKIEQQNIYLNQYTVNVSEKFLEAGFRNIILKGQGIASYYLNPLHRQCGDIDIYMEGGRQKILNYLSQFGVEKKGVVYHHIDCSTSKADIECHTHCSWFFDPFKNRSFQQKSKQWLVESFDNYVSVGEGKIAIPCVEMNQYYILHHIFRHLFSEGIGLRQLCDYAVLMERTYSKENAKVYLNNLKKFGMLEFAGAVFYILITYLKYPQNKVPVNIDSDKFGPVLFEEIMRAGNFGKYDPRVAEIDQNSNWSKFSKRIKRNLTFFTYFPGEVAFTPLFKLWHYGWRKIKGYC